MRDLPTPPPGEPSAAEAALGQLGKLVTAGAPPDTVTRAVGEIIAGWAGEADMDAATARDRISGMWDSLTKDEADLQEAISDAGVGEGGSDAASLSMAQRTQAALQAAIQALAAAAERFG